MQAPYDAIIVGGGLVGGTVANELQDLDWRTALVDATHISEPGDSLSPFVSALNANSRQMLQDLSVWQQLDEQQATAYKYMRVYDNQGGGQITFAAEDLGYEALGHIVNNQALKYWLQHSYVEKAGRLYAQQKASDLTKQVDNWQLTLQNGEVLQSPLIIAADGGRSWVRYQANIGCYHWSYEQIAFVATLQTEEMHNHTAWQWFHPSGVLAFLPLADAHHVAIVWSVNAANAERINQYSADHFCLRLQALTAQRLGKLKLASAISQYPLRMNHANQYVKAGLALVGDAAHTIHPLAGQGVNLGLRDASTLVRVLKQARDKGRQYYTYDTLRQYERARQGDVWAMVAIMECFKRGFVNDSKTCAWLRSQGLTMTDRCDLLKRFFFKQASG